MKKILKKIGIMLMVALMSVSLIACDGGSSGGGSGSGKNTPEASVRAIYKAYEDKDAEKLFELMYDPYYIEYVIKDEGYDDKDELMEGHKKDFADELDEVEDECGRDFKFTVEVLDKIKFDKDEIKAINKYLYEEEGDIYYDEIVLEDICILKVEVACEGEDGSVEFEKEVPCYKIDGKWYGGDNSNGVIISYFLDDALYKYGSSGGGKNTPEDAVRAMLKAREDKDAEKFFELAYDPYYIEYVIKDEGYDDKDEAMDEFSDYFRDSVDYLEDEYGEDFKIYVEVTDETEYDKDEVEAVNKYLYEEGEDIYDDEEVIEEIIILELEVTIKGEDDSEEYDTKLAVYKIDGDWYVEGMGLINIYLLEEALDEYGE